jgi:hypothetical protein
MTNPGAGARVTIVVTQRERMSAMKEALDALYANTRGPFELVYVVGRIAGARRRWLTAEADKRGFRLVEAGLPLTPAESRNLGVAEARTEYVQFIENDVLPKDGWLDALVACADETNADVVVPLTCEGRPVHTIIHHVGLADELAPGEDGVEAGRRDYRETLYLQGQTREVAAASLVRRRTRTCEFHCVMVRRSVFDRIGLFDPAVVSKEHLDFSWRLARAGCTIWVEPKAVVTFLVPSDNDPVKVADLPYFLLRWSPTWQRRSHDILKQRWGFQERGFIASRRRLADWRIVDHVVKPALRKVPVLGKRWGFVERSIPAVYPAASLAATLLAWRYDSSRNRASSKDSAGATA